MTSAHNAEDVRIFHKECISLAREGYDVYLVERGESYEKNGVHIIGVGECTGGRLSRMTSFARKVYKAAMEVNADLYHFHDPELLPYGLKLKKAGKKVIFDSHERYTEQLRSKPYLPKTVSVLVADIYGIYEKYVLKKLDAVIFPCTMNGKNPFAGLCKRAAIISNAAVLGEFFDRYDPNSHKIDRSICYVGGLSEDRGITVDMQAAAQAHATFLLAGTFSPPDYEQLLRKIPAFSYVDYRGQLNRAGVAELLSQTKVGMCTLLDRGQYLKTDTFGIKVFEYFSMGVPVVLSHSPYNDQMVQKHQFGICVDPTDIKSISDAITYLLDHPNEAKQMGENGRRAVKEEFNWEIEEKKLFSLYEELLCDKN